MTGTGITKIAIAVCGVVLVAGVAAILLAATHRPAVADIGVAHYTAEGNLVPPADYREWVFLSSGLDMSYSETPVPVGTHIFDNVFAAPAAYRAFRKTGRWPEGTVLILENRAGVGRGSINRSGRFQTADVIGLEAHVKDTDRFEGGWGFFAFAGGTPAERLPYTADCYSCHQAHAAVDTTFVQFYPTLLPIAERHGTISPNFDKETPASPAAPVP